MKNKSMVIAVLLTVFNLLVCNAASISSEVDADNLTVSILDAEANISANMVITAPNDSLMTGPFLLVTDMVTDENGNAQMNYKLPPKAPSGTYSVAVNLKEEQHKDSFVYENTMLLQKFSDAKSSADIKSALELYGETINLNMQNYFILPENYRFNVAELIYKKGDYDTAVKIKEKFNLAVALLSVTASNNNVETDELYFDNIIKKYADILKLNVVDYNKLTKDAQAYVAEKMKGVVYYDVEGLQNAFNEGIIVSFFKTAIWPGVQEYTVFSASTLLKFDFNNKYQALTDKSIPLKAVVMAASSIDSSEKISSIFNDAVNVAYAEQSKGQQGGGTGSGGGNNFSTGNNKKPPVVPIEPKDESLYTDLEDTQWASGYIERLSAIGAVNGIGDKKFNPNGIVTREQFLKMLIISFKFEEAEGSVDFSDVSKDDWYYNYVLTGVKLGLVKGTSETEFGVNTPISRQDMIVMLQRALEKKGVKLEKISSEKYSDDDSIADYAKKAVYILTSYSVIGGVGDNMFAPINSASRAEATKVICLSLDLIL